MKALFDHNPITWSEEWAFSLAMVLICDTEQSFNAINDTIAIFPWNSQNLLENDPFNGARKTQFARILLKHIDRTAIAQRPRLSARDYDFFSLPWQARAAIVLKAQGHFSNSAIADLLDLSTIETERLIETARHQYSQGQTWVYDDGNLPPMPPNVPKGTHWHQCPNWDGDLLFARYLQKDLSTEESKHLHEHFYRCARCRHSLVKFKERYSDWLSTLPQIKLSQEQSYRLQKVLLKSGQRQRLRNLQLGITPSPWPGMMKVLKDPSFQILLAAIALCFILFRNY